MAVGIASRTMGANDTAGSIEAALKGEKLNVVGDGKEFLDFTYIEDLAKGCVDCCSMPAMIARDRSQRPLTTVTSGFPTVIVPVLSSMTTSNFDARCRT